MTQKVVFIIIFIFVLLGVVIGAFLFVQKSNKKTMHEAGNTTISNQDIRDSAKIRYLPLGDSYTIGQSVENSGRWPNQLAAQYRPSGKSMEIVANPAVTGYTTQDLINKELPLVTDLHPDFVTVQIGVNDYVQGVDTKTFEKNLRFIIQQLQIKLANPNNILLVTIPDYAKTPTGAQFGDPTKATAAIQYFNQIIETTAVAYKLPKADVFPISQSVRNDPSLTASDGLHPSAKQYKLWTSIIQQNLEAAHIPN